MLQLKPEIRSVLTNMDFIAKYRNLSAKYSFNSEESFEAYDNNEVLNFFAE